jgi:hypothetical protein
MARETKTETQVAIGRPDRKAQLLDFLERTAWPKVPRDVRGKPLSRKDEDAILGYGPEGV